MQDLLKINDQITQFKKKTLIPAIVFCDNYFSSLKGNLFFK